MDYEEVEANTTEQMNVDAAGNLCNQSVHENLSSLASEDDDTIALLDDDEIIQKLAMSTNIASAIMLRIPTHCLPLLRKSFEEEEGELNLTQYLQVFIKNMDFESDEALFAIIPDLVDLFNQVDING
jgi:hypothetical protein